ncbi:hypothetical protein HDA41_008168 [Streptomyces caelestis]|uniref:Uncharacterized protein n=1 Tax=Streptomyces caelestis TaxID=36816 RepID=A0A7W9LXX4_9ACTN|nr:hypothetical protein [Streptomyces caelestis]
MMSDAGIRPTVTRVRSDEEKLTSITGAKRFPAGEPTKNANAPFRGMGTRTGRPPKESCKAAEARKVVEARKAAQVRKAR